MVLGIWGFTNDQLQWGFTSNLLDIVTDRESTYDLICYDLNCGLHDRIAILMTPVSIFGFQAHTLQIRKKLSR